MSEAWKPEGYSSVSPYLVTREAQAVIDFAVAALEATPLRRYENDDGSILHAEFRVDDTVVMLGEAGDGWAATPCYVHVYVPDVDAAFSSALAAGAESVQEPSRNGDDPDRRCGVKDPGGNTWWLGTQIEATS